MSTLGEKNKLSGRITGFLGHVFNLQMFLKVVRGEREVEMPVDCFSFKQLGTSPVLSHLMLLSVNGDNLLHLLENEVTSEQILIQRARHPVV